MANNKKYVVKLTEEERTELRRIAGKGNVGVWKIKRAQVFLKCDQAPAGPAWTDSQIAEAFGVTTRCIENWRKRAVHEGPLSVLERKPRLTPPTPPILDGESGARLTKLACSTPPEGSSRWSLRLLSARLVELKVVDAISHETVRRALKKTTAANLT